MTEQMIEKLDGTECIWNEKITCPVLKRIHQQRMANERIKEDDDGLFGLGSVAKTMTAQMSMEFGFLHAYCHLCPSHSMVILKPKQPKKKTGLL